MPSAVSGLPMPFSGSSSGGGLSPEQMGFGMMGAGIGNLMSNWQNPASAGMDFLSNPDILKWLQSGAMHPGEMINDIGSNYHQSPGFQFALQQALQGAKHASAMGGMAGTPQASQQSMQIATGLADQDYNNWMKNALGLQNNMSTNYLNNNLMRALLSYQGANAENEHSGGIAGLLGGAGGILGNIFGGPAGGMAGSAIGSVFGNMFG